MARRLPSAVALLAAVILVAAALSAGDPSEVSVHGVAAFRVVYEVEDLAGEPATRIETLDVRRPYDGRLVAPTSGRLSNREFLWELEGDGTPKLGYRRTPGGAVRDLSYAALRDAAAAGAIDLVGAGSWLGRSCTWFAFGDPFPQPLVRPSEEGRVEACVDGDGILLREIWTIEDKVARIVEATSVDLVQADDDAFFLGRDPEDDEVDDREVAELLRSQTVVADDVPTPDVPLVIEPPQGWEVDRRSVVVVAPGSGRAGQLASDTFVEPEGEGGRLVVVERTLRSGEAPTWPTGEGEPMEVGFGSGRVVWFGDRVELRITTDDAAARIFAPDLAIARAFAAGLRKR